MIHIHAFVAARRQIVVFIMPFLWYTNFITFAKEAFALKIQESAENYLEAILMIKQEKGQVRSIDVVNELGFSKPSVSVAMKHLEQDGYIERDSSGQISLLPPGKKNAETIYERHNTLIKILTHLGVDPQIAREDACRIEHHISAESFEALKKHCKSIL